MRALLDTHLLIWIAGPSERLPTAVREVVDGDEYELYFSVASLWEIAIKNSLGRADFEVDPGVLRRQFLDDEYVEVPVLGPHTVTVATLPPIHGDPFDRMLVAQAITEGVELFTVDRQLARYPGPIRVF
jgi:PIN domain nuclease of toxin-antitoxin system